MEYELIEEFEEISKRAKEKIASEQYLINFNLKVNFPINLVSNCMSSVYEDALNFQNPICPEVLHMNHGEYIHKFGNGINNVINQLKEKQASNRAIISLINQENIMESKDNPIPSFMILQFSIENETKLYVTTYFRALEVSKFLKINTEEIRQIIKKVSNNFLSLTEVYLNIIAFRAYIDDSINPLKKTKIELLKEREFLRFLRVGSDLNDLIDLLEEKKVSSTVIEYESFQNILDWLQDHEYSLLIDANLRKPLIIQILKEIIEILVHLKSLREKTSHNTEIDENQGKYKEKLEQLIREIRNDS
ncbi:hypothetical protein ACNO6Z_10880 [Aliarcobacter lanthieri]|uniref:hypothetical protein n=1 Tax=Aliarcobacter lanthieri TaxID=1355374 RepID=UPI003AA8D2A0